MKEVSGWFNSINKDRNYDSFMFDVFIRYFSTNGVWQGGGYLVVSPDPNNALTLRVTPGMATVRGKIYAAFDDGVGDPYMTLAVQPAVSQPYIGRVVLRMNNVQDADGRHVTLAFKAGGESSSPVAPALQREEDGSIWEICLAEATVYPTTMIIDASQIKDTRFDYALCGIADFAVNPKIEGVVAQGFTQSYHLWDCLLPVNDWEEVGAEEYPIYAGMWMQRFPVEADDNIYSDMSGNCDITDEERINGRTRPFTVLSERGHVAVVYTQKPTTDIRVDIRLERSGRNLYG